MKWGRPRWWHTGALVHVLLGALFAAPIAFVAYSFTLALLDPPDRPLERVALIPLLVLSTFLVTGIALLPQVRGTEITIAQRLLGVELPEPVAAPTLATRLLGAAWLTVVTGLGAAAVLGLLLLVPPGLAFLAFPFQGHTRFTWPGTELTSSWGSGAGVWWMIPLGLVCVVVAAATTLLGSRALVSWAPTFLGPTEADIAAVQEHAARQAAGANALARDLHDSVGRSLTAITIQASAAQVLLNRDPARAVESLRAIERTGRTAVEELDAVMGILRNGVSAHMTIPATSLAEIVATARQSIDVTADVRTDISRLPEYAADAVCRVTQEGLANATLHGTGSAAVVIREEDDDVVVTLLNQVPPQDGTTADPEAEPSGLAGLRERLLLVGGTLETDQTEDNWRLQARIPLGGNR